MEFAIVLIIGILGLLLVVPLVALAKASAAKRISEELAMRVRALENEVRGRQHGTTPAQPQRPEEKEPVPQGSIHPELSRMVPVPRPIPAVIPPKPEAHPVEGIAASISSPFEPPKREPPAPAESPLPSIEWEQFMGAKLFAWIGGLALFLGIAFFVKYSFEHNLIPPEVRVAIGFLAGVGLLIGGMLMKRKENAVTAQTLCGTGILVLYAVTFACHSYYHFPFFGLGKTFVLMALITAVAFLLSVRMDALVVGVLGVAGGFLTPVILSTGQDNPLALFSYIALLDVGLLAIAQRQHWKSLPGLGAIGTLLMQGAWIANFFVAHRYFLGNKVLVPMAVLAGFQVLFLVAAWWAKRAGKSGFSVGNEAMVVGAVSLLAAFYFLAFPPLGHRPILLCGYLFFADVALVALTLVVRQLAPIRTPAGIAAFIFLGVWTDSYLTNGNLPAALGCYLAFAILHTALPPLLQRIEKTATSLWSQLFPVLSLALVLFPICRFHDLSILIWPFVLLVDILAFVVAIVTMALVPVLLVFLLTLVAIGTTLLQVSSDLTGLPTDLFLLGGCAIFFLAAGVWAGRRIKPKDAVSPQLFGSPSVPENLAIQLPALSAVLPFLLLIMVTLRLPLHDPSSVFGLALLLAVLLLGLAKILSLDALPVVGLLSLVALEHSWLHSPFYSRDQLLSLKWNVLFYAIFTLFPFAFLRQTETRKAPWIASALAGPLHFYLVYDVVKIACPAIPHGFLPAIFALPSLGGLAVLAQRKVADKSTRESQLALFGGVALFFITLIFPLQFERQWITIGWALEGAALCWLFRRVPHPGLKLVGAGLLAVSFARLGLNPYVLSYHSAALYPIFNWYLYAYGVVWLALFAGADLLARPRNFVAGINAPPWLYTMGTVLLFLLVNIEIADYFSQPGAPVLTFEFSGNFARDMSYSIAWAIFALILLLVGMRKNSRAVRYGSLGLLSITLLKLFLHDLSELDQLYRIGAFIVVAIIAILASFLYQRFFAFSPHEAESRH